MSNENHVLDDTIIVFFDDKFTLCNIEKGRFFRIAPSTFETLLETEHDKNHPIKQTSVYKQLLTSGFLRNDDSTGPGRRTCLDLKNAGLLPGIKRRKGTIRTLSLFPSNICNLDCIYCYGTANRKKQPLMDFETAVKSIDWFFGQLPEDAQVAALGFHGGGEPSLNETLIRRSVDYFRSECDNRGLSSRFSMITNGTLNISFLDWCIDNSVNVNFSFDGTEEIQNHQRPRRGGEGSFQEVEKRLVHYKTRTDRLSIRATVTASSVLKLEDITRYFIKLGADIIKYEPVVKAGGGFEQYDELAVDFGQFREAFFRSYLAGLNSDVRVSTSKLLFPTPQSSSYCSSSGRIACVTPDAVVTSCVEDSESMLEERNPFAFGEVEKKGNVRIAEERYRYLQDRIVNNMESCSSCDWRYYCSGYCPMETFRKTGNIYSPDSELCTQIIDFNQKLILFLFDNYPSVEMYVHENKESSYLELPGKKGKK